MNDLDNIKELKQEHIGDMIKLFKSAYKNMEVPDDEYECFVEEVNAAFDTKQIYKIKFFGIFDKSKLVSFAGIAEALFYAGAWDLRWGTTHPDYQRKGLMTKLIKYRIEYAINITNNMPGIINIASRNPSFMLQHGFEPIFKRGPENSVTYMAKYFNKHLQDKL